VAPRLAMARPALGHALRHPRQPRLVRRAHRVHAAVRPGPLDRRGGGAPNPPPLPGAPAPPLGGGGRGGAGLAGGGRHNPRGHSAPQLPPRWWVWGVDIQSEALIDEPQLDFFARVAERAQPGDKLVLATAVPRWTLLDGN